VMWARRRQTNGTRLRLASPLLDWWRRIGRGCHQRAAAAEQWRRGRGSSDSSEDRGGAEQGVALVAPRCPREVARRVPGLGEPAEGRAGSSGSVEKAARLGQHAGVQALCVQGEG
jgi:hypothetical protein